MVEPRWDEKTTYVELVFQFSRNVKAEEDHEQLENTVPEEAI